MNKRTAIRSIALSAVIAAVYTALTMSLPMLSYGPVQLRFSEALTVLPFFLPEAVPGLFLGCVIANLFSPFGIADVIFGSIATLLAALWTSKLKNPWFAPLPPVISNAVIIGAEHRRRDRLVRDLLWPRFYDLLGLERLYCGSWRAGRLLCAGYAAAVSAAQNPRSPAVPD